MEKCWVIACAALGCNGIFEHNPAFNPDTDGSTSATSATSASSSEEGPTECGGVDMYEPNDSESQLAILTGVDSQAVVPIAAELQGAIDEDWFKLPVDQTGAAAVQPTIVVAAPEPVRVCGYIHCSVGTAVIDCGSHTPDTNAANANGCCGDDGVSYSYVCDGAVDLDASTYLRVTTAGPTDACIPYELEYRFTP